MPLLNSATLGFSWFQNTITSWKQHLSAHLHCVSWFQILNYTGFFSAGLSNSLTFTLGVSVGQLFSMSVSHTLSTSLFSCLSSIHAHIHIAQVPLGKLLSLPVNSAMLLLALDPKGNIMNNEQSRERVGWGSRMCRWAACEREGERPFRIRKEWRDEGRVTC